MSDDASATRAVYEAMERPIVVLGPVDTGRCRDVEGGILDARRRGEEPLLEGEGVEEGLEGRSRLPPCAGAVDERRRGERAAAADPGEDVAGRVVDDHRRAVADVPAAEGDELVAEGAGNELLDAGVEGRHDVSSRCERKEARCNVRRQHGLLRNAGRLRQHGESAGRCGGG